MDSYEELLKDYEESGIVPAAKIKRYVSWNEANPVRQCPWCLNYFTVSLTEDQSKVIHCPICCMEVEYEV